MIETSQIFLIAAIAITSVILTIIGVQLIFVLYDLRKLLSKANAIVDELEKVGMNLNHGYSEITGFLSGIKNLFFIVDLLNKKKKKKDGK